MTGAQRDDLVVAGAVLRVLADGREAVGGAFLVGTDLVATCAHVVADALGGDPYSPAAPTAPVHLDFPLIRDEEGAPVRTTAQVAGWTPIAEDGSGDLALLRLRRGDAPEAARMPPLRRIEQLWGQGFWVLGFPDGGTHGVWSTGLIRGEQGTRWFQLQSTPGERRIEGGFSGAPVWHVESGAVVGMTVAADRGDTTTAYLIPIDQVLGQDPELLPCPYRGLRPFGEEHAHAFHGRDAEIERLVDAVARQPVVAVAGPSGVGKSSLVRAGLLPRLRAGGAEIVDLRPGDPEPRANGNQVLLLDQFEELAGADPAGARRLLERVVAQGTRAVLTMRWAALDELLTPRLARTLEAGTVLVAPLDRARLREAIVRPAEGAPGLAFEPGLVERILDDAGTEPGQLPLVESLLADLWERREGGYLTLRGYADAGGVAGALRQHAERVLESIETHPDPLRRLFTSLARPDATGRFTRRPVSLAELPAEQRALVGPLVAGRLLVADGDVVELAHQALIDHWPRLRDWLTDDREFLSWRARVQEQRKQWEATARDDGALPRGTALAAAIEWTASRGDEVSEVDRDFVRRGRARQRREVRRWRAVTAGLAVLALLAATLSVYAVNRRQVLAGQLATANAETLGLQSQARAATDPALAAQLALAAWRSDPDNAQARTALARSYLAFGSVDLELAGLTANPVNALLAAGDTAVLQTTPHPVLVTGLAGPTPRHSELPDVPGDQAVTLSPDGRLLAYPGPGGVGLRVRELTGNAGPRTIAGGSRVLQPLFTPAGDRLQAVVQTGAGGFEVRTWDVRTGAELPGRLGQLPPEATAAWPTADPDRALVRYGSQDRQGSRLVLRSLTDGSEVATLPDGALVAGSGAFAVSCADYQTLAITPLGGTGTPRTQPAESGCGAWRLRSGDGGWLVDDVSAGLPGADYTTLRLTNIATGEARDVLAPRSVNPGQPSSTPVFRPSSDLAVVSSGGRTSVLLAQGGALLRLRTTAAPDRAEPPRREAVSLSDSLVLAMYHNGVAVVDRETGRRLGQIDGLDANFYDPEIDGDSIWTVDPKDHSWVMTRYQLPDLRRITSVEVPDRHPDGTSPREPTTSPLHKRIQVSPVPDSNRLLVANGGWLYTFDRTTGAPVGNPIQLATDPKAIRFASLFTSAMSRPKHPDQVAILTNDMSIQLWDLNTAKIIGTVPARCGCVALFDPSGDQIVVQTDTRTLEVWNLSPIGLARPALPAPDQSIYGVDDDGHLLTWSYSDRRMSFLDLATGREAGSMMLAGLPSTSSTEDGRQIRLSVQGLTGSVSTQPGQLSVTAPAWRDRLCAVADRPFTEAERALLPDGTDIDRPCS
ncbi:hypothetical protein GCM10023321_37910 [Pseudonocardia eucalypti]|uniref:Novel STAND NTPase 1 domain-containing protein n=1 Tax=Pseudonocardia eucalypti TaxID=648755 RepID=A0ABP9Q8R1_9PSEU|nr:WD40 repeat protein [Pseudonocardia eucalypti]